MTGEGKDIGSFKRLLRFTGVVVKPGEVLYTFRVKMWKIREIKLEEEKESNLTRTCDFRSLVVVFNFSVALFLLLSVGLIGSQAHIFNKLSIYVVPSD